MQKCGTNKPNLRRRRNIGTEPKIRLMRRWSFQRRSQRPTSAGGNLRGRTERKADDEVYEWQEHRHMLVYPGQTPSSTAVLLQKWLQKTVLSARQRSRRRRRWPTEIKWMIHCASVSWCGERNIRTEGTIYGSINSRKMCTATMYFAKIKGTVGSRGVVKAMVKNPHWVWTSAQRNSSMRPSVA